MGHWVGVDVGKTAHWVHVLDDEGKEVLSRKVQATEEDIEAAHSEIAVLDGADERAFCVDIVGGPATLLEAVLLDRSERVFHLPGMAVNRARDAYPGGEHKSDPKDARVIADQLRMRWHSLAEVKPRGEAAVELRVLLGHRRDLVQDQVRRIARLRGLLLEVFPGLESILDFTKDGPLLAVTKVATPTAARRLGEARLARWLKARGVRKADDLARRIVEAAKTQHYELPAAELKTELVAEIASELRKTRERIGDLDKRLEGLVSASPEARLVKSLPGMGTIFSAEFVAEVGDIGRFASSDALAAAAGMAPVLRESGSSSHLRRSRRGNGVLKRALYRSAFTASAHHGPSREFYRRKRAEGKTHHQALIALARRRVNVLWAMLRDGQPYREQPPKAA
jgi:transposase